MSNGITLCQFQIVMYKSLKGIAKLEYFSNFYGVNISCDSDFSECIKNDDDLRISC